jgi:hypothetical protein
MATKTKRTKKPARPVVKNRTVAARAGAALSREAKIAYGEIESGVQNLEKSIAEIRKGAIRAEKKIEADAHRQIRELRKEARTHLGTIDGARRDAGRRLNRLAAGADESWREIKEAADTILKEATRTASSVLRRLKRTVAA